MRDHDDKARAEQAIRLLFSMYGMTAEEVIEETQMDIAEEDREAYIKRVIEIERETEE